MEKETLKTGSRNILYRTYLLLSCLLYYKIPIKRMVMRPRCSKSNREQTILPADKRLHVTSPLILAGIARIKVMYHIREDQHKRLSTAQYHHYYLLFTVENGPVIVDVMKKIIISTNIVLGINRELFFIHQNT